MRPGIPGAFYLVCGPSSDMQANLGIGSRARGSRRVTDELSEEPERGLAEREGFEPSVQVLARTTV